MPCPNTESSYNEWKKMKSQISMSSKQFDVWDHQLLYVKWYIWTRISVLSEISHFRIPYCIIRDVIQEIWNKLIITDNYHGIEDFFVVSTIGNIVLPEHVPRNRCSAFLQNLKHIEKRYCHNYKLNFFRSIVHNKK